MTIRVEKVEKKVPMPSRKGKSWKEPRLPYPTMTVGDSFFVPLPSSAEERRVEYDRVKTLAQYYQSTRRGWKYSLRTEGDGIRVWRIK